MSKKKLFFFYFSSRKVKREDSGETTTADDDEFARERDSENNRNRHHNNVLQKKKWNKNNSLFYRGCLSVFKLDKNLIETLTKWIFTKRIFFDEIFEEWSQSSFISILSCQNSLQKRERTSLSRTEVKKTGKESNNSFIRLFPPFRFAEKSWTSIKGGYKKK